MYFYGEKEINSIQVYSLKETNSLFLFCLSNASATIFTVDANFNSVTLTYFEHVTPPYTITGPVNTGMYLNPGDLLEVSSIGLWGNGTQGYYPEYGPDGNPNENISPGYAGAGYPVGALLGRIGNNSYFFIGSDYSNQVSQSGILYLGFNDTDYGNNWGTVNADVNISPVPEPSTMLLLGSGLLGLFGLRRKPKSKEANNNHADPSRNIEGIAKNRGQRTFHAKNIS
ncbi:MAG: PEP-CTERM sorting domain-containing protein [Deltaproteobacteria bacterium]|nr:PEP-CTERM sorting domain-containing protein [Deltaproteobacteria bacterium]